ncbi:SAM-dependent methyltransferase [Pseudomonas piscis]|uniref:SAM-dependent methyltransferase n=1 Tax=Pseudomonas piscis TaxID=2614538 RepID=A0ABY9NML6_9PSED|nr:SAM-dependent methyltransferase [Pseudomonas piscis]WMN19686.1 SAM-dependent methyltransferase [Pseudomonas piscis]
MIEHLRPALAWVNGSDAPEKPTKKLRLVMIDNGMAEVRSLEELLKRSEKLDIIAFDADYNRISRSLMLTGEQQFEDITLSDLGRPQEHGIEAEVVNGITAGLAGATSCDISLTLRGVVRGVTLLTAHTQDDSPLDWQALAQGGTTLVIYMGVAKLTDIGEQLRAAGMPDWTPVAMIENASLPEQRECRSMLGNMQQDALDFELKSPAILVIGAVAATAGTSATRLLQA